jgi:hypothetical protein
MPTPPKICLTFAGVVGSSKTPIANFLSPKLNLPVFNNDALRSEVTEDLGHFDPDEHRRRRELRLKEILASGASFICDASVDREWPEFRKSLTANGYEWFIISLNLGKELITKLYQAKGYTESQLRIDELINDHNIFLEKYSGDIGLHLDDADFPKRLQICYDKIVGWLKK